MLFSPEKKFIFLKTPKTAGTSLEYALAPQLGSGAIVTLQTGEDYPEQRYAHVTWVGPKKFIRESAKALFEGRTREFVAQLIKDVLGRKGPIRSRQLVNEFDHMDACSVKALIGSERFNKCLKVAVCRNPYDQIISFYFWKMYERSVNVPPLPDMSFDEWLREHPYAMQENRKIVSIDGELVVDFVIHFERLEEDLVILCNKLDFDYEEILRVMEVNRFKSDQRPRGEAGDRKNLISPESKSVIDFFMDWDFRTFGYEKAL